MHAWNFFYIGGQEPVTKTDRTCGHDPWLMSRELDAVLLGSSNSPAAASAPRCSCGVSKRLSLCDKMSSKWQRMMQQSACGHSLCVLHTCLSLIDVTLCSQHHAAAGVTSNRACVRSSLTVPRMSALLRAWTYIFSSSLNIIKHQKDQPTLKT